MVNYMKKLLVSVILFSFIVFNNLEAKSDYDYNFDKERVIEFDSLTSNNINYVFNDLDIYMIDIDVMIGLEVMTFRINTYLYKDIEREITRKVINDLIENNKREYATIAEIKGYKVIKARLICSDRTLDIIRFRANNLAN